MSDNGYRLFSLDERTARKSHRCIWCGEEIEVGTKYLDERSVYEGEMQLHRWHPECMPVCRAALRKSGDDSFDAYQNDRPKPTEARHA